jgi:hypothetical protein
MKKSIFTVLVVILAELTYPDGDPKCRSKVRIKLICQLFFSFNIWFFLSALILFLAYLF